MTFREMTEQRERETLSKWASLSCETKGRVKYLEPCVLRTDFQRDRDRIVHCKAFRRLTNKTQVFLSPVGDHYRTRLTHTLEVSQVARTISRALNLNEDLTEAIALGHDLGHTPFGHAGERALNEVSPFGFHHHLQSVRVVDRIERGGEGLNLTYEVKNGIACHTTGSTPSTHEGAVVRYADKIAYLNHDIEDACRAGILTEDSLPWEVKYTLGRSKTERITSLVLSLVNNSDETIKMDDECEKAFKILRSFMFDTVYVDSIAKTEESKAENIVKTLYEYFLRHTEKIPDEYERILETEGSDRAIADYISGMSDRYCILVYNDIFIPRSWNIISND